jgi:glycerophosphoryl diester phosphodiesterase
VSQWNTLNHLPPRIVAHRGASGYRPEHTLEGYTLAAAQGADVLEPDLLMSRDGVLFVRHDLGLARSTDIAARPEFAPRAREVAGVRDWWIADFTAAELDSLHAIQPFPQRGNLYDGKFAVPRFSSVLDLLTSLSAQCGRKLGLYPELKHPEYFLALGLDPIAALHAELAPRDLLGPASTVWLQCFDHGVLRQAHERCGNPCFALLETMPADLHERDRLLHELAPWAGGIAPGKHLLWGDTGKDSGLVAAAHARGLQAHAWTFRDDQSTAPFATVRAELEAAFALGVDALFCDFPDTARAARTVLPVCRGKLNGGPQRA